MKAATKPSGVRLEWPKPSMSSTRRMSPGPKAVGVGVQAGDRHHRRHHDTQRSAARDVLAQGQDRVHGRVVVVAERLERGRGVDVGRDPGPVVLGPGGLPEQVADVGAELAVGKLERDDLAVEVGPGAGGLADEDRLGLAADGGRGVLRGRERQPADDAPSSRE
jgi:hypothetical protein